VFLKCVLPFKCIALEYSKILFCFYGCSSVKFVDICRLLSFFQNQDYFHVKFYKYFQNLLMWKDSYNIVFLIIQKCP